MLLVLLELDQLVAVTAQRQERNCNEVHHRLSVRGCSKKCRQSERSDKPKQNIGAALTNFLTRSKRASNRRLPMLVVSRAGDHWRRAMEAMCGDGEE